MLTLVALSLALADACSGKLPSPAPANAAKCGDQCATVNCPAGSHCSLSDNCTARCDPEFIPHK